MYHQIPPLIRRNTALFALTQSFTGTGMQFAYGFGPLMVMELTGSASLAGLSVSLIGLSRFLVAYPAGKVTDAYGRKPGIQLGLILAFCGCLILFLAMNKQSIVIFAIGLLIFGMGMNASQQLRVAAADMYPPRMRAQALGFVALGSLVGLAFAPILISISDAVAPRLGQDPLGLPWLMLPIVIVAGMIIANLVRPDPKEIGMNLQKYYPDYVPPPQLERAAAQPFNSRLLFADRRLLIATVSNSAANGNMSIVMVLTSLVLHHHGHSLLAIAISHMFHSAGMFGFTIPLGRLADRFGREAVMFPGVATTIVGALLLALTSAWWSVTLGTFLVGIGWAAANVAATALIADHAPAEHRGRAIGVNDSCAGATSVFAALVTGPLIDWSGLPATGLTAVLLAAIPFVLLLVRKPAAQPQA
ncbi:MFS transporter [Methylocella sp. CPCC 101449]|uniref:MFS transporter n=1 Tax=Methylocella sp. CPCC 101449 TaxID=2987531 RepID=UPI00288DFF17|nr:MFS transporter [Methylocella sp. CPCC 101449]MDT2021776.1 MFS transporter [Methylocella sp. CPCC 101449]